MTFTALIDGITDVILFNLISILIKTWRDLVPKVLVTIILKLLVLLYKVLNIFTVDLVEIFGNCTKVIHIRSKKKIELILFV